MKIQTKITLLFFSISTIGLILLNASIFYFVSEFNFEDFFERLESRVNLAARINIYPNSSPETYHEIRTRYLEKLEDEKDYIIKLDPSEKEGFRRPLDLPEKFYSNILSRGKDRFSDRNRFYAGALFNTAYGQYIVIVAASDPYGFKELADLKKVLAISFFVSIILAFIAGKVFSHYTIKPVGAIISSVKSITANNLHSRLDEVKGKDEIAELAHTFNNMLTRLETAFETQNNFVSNASHELRTPLAIITSETEYLLSRPGLSKEAEKSAQAVLAEAGKLEHILTSLLGLAQSGFDGKKQNWQKIRVDELIWQVVDSVKKIEPDSIIDIDYSALPEDESRLCIDGNVNLLHLAVSNIVMNGCKYSNNQPVRIKIIADSNMVIISVTDQGIGIPKQEQQHVFEPFFRASNTSEFEGYGIGLPLTLNIIRLHKGSIGIRSEEKMGTEMQILLPCSV
ncbi:HAMP domain-containing sensor histidine kinase [Pararcticibacter amylolyticus]|uniref:histidine kinase n=1 Tax=Pararcticibacter amylolyticus TaxID=2173175 RepID=A0A2U2PGJ5_9SPHI|nr:HAMP domain-containing sensor histidine kinase [Pararcticibacter amylolyticus]PWG80249.1 sensor histidine kinase [Pararcticibacter amylolyticus]